MCKTKCAVCDNDARCGYRHTDEHQAADGLAEEEEVEDDNTRPSEHFGKLVEGDSVVFEAEVAKDEEPSEKPTERHYLQDGKSDCGEHAEWA